MCVVRLVVSDMCWLTEGRGRLLHVVGFAARDVVAEVRRGDERLQRVPDRLP